MCERKNYPSQTPPFPISIGDPSHTPNVVAYNTAMHAWSKRIVDAHDGAEQVEATLNCMQKYGMRYVNCFKILILFLLGPTQMKKEHDA